MPWQDGEACGGQEQTPEPLGGQKNQDREKNVLSGWQEVIATNLGSSHRFGQGT